jgi:hypothetical protein
MSGAWRSEELLKSDFGQRRVFFSKNMRDTENEGYVWVTCLHCRLTTELRMVLQRTFPGQREYCLARSSKCSKASYEAPIFNAPGLRKSQRSDAHTQSHNGNYSRAGAAWRQHPLLTLLQLIQIPRRFCGSTWLLTSTTFTSSPTSYGEISSHPATLVLVIPCL